jgi:hypothetical protein
LKAHAVAGIVGQHDINFIKIENGTELPGRLFEEFRDAGIGKDNCDGKQILIPPNYGIIIPG